MAFVPAQFGEYDPHAGMGGFSFKKLFKVTKKSFQPKTILKVAASVVHAAIRPVEVVARATTAVALQSVGLKTLAKVQVNNSWECSAVPYLPVPDLVEEHLDRLEKAGVKAT